MMPGVNFVIYMVAPLREQLKEYHYNGASHWRKILLQFFLNTTQ